MTINANTQDILDVINLDALNAYNAERVEEEEPPISIREAYEQVEELVVGYAEDLREGAAEKASHHIDRFVDYNWRSYDGNTLEFADNYSLVVAIAQSARKNLF